MALQRSIPTTVITGLVCNGKTTLLSALLKQKELANTAVIINEFGEIGLDSLQVKGVINIAGENHSERTN